MKKAYKRIVTRIRNFVGYHENTDPFLKEMIPLLIISELTAQGPFKINGKGKMVVNFTSIRGLYFILTNGLLTYAIIENYFGQDVMHYFREGHSDSLYFGFINLLIGALHFSNILSLIIKWKPFFEYIEEWTKLNVEFERVMGISYMFKCKWIIVMTSLMLPFISILIIPLTTRRKVGAAWYYNYIPTVMFLSLTTEFLGILFSYVELMFIGSSINSKLKSLVKGNRLTAKKIHDLRVLWLRCSHVVRLTGKSLTLRSMVDVGGSIMIFSVANFALFCNLASRNFDVSDYTISIICIWIRLFCFFEVGELTTQYVGSNIRFTMSIARIDLLDDRAANEMELFILNISSNYPHINVNGFTRVSRRVLYAVMEQAMLYIIVLIQMKMSR